MIYSAYFKKSQVNDGDKINKKQKEALGYYRYCNMQLDRFSESIFYVPGGSREKELLNAIKVAVDKCTKLGVGRYC